VGNVEPWKPWKSVAEEERINFLTVTHRRTLCQDERILRKHKEVLWRMDLRDVRKISREKRGGGAQERDSLTCTTGISVDDSTVLQKYLDLVD
jgi:hypothetical protein